MKRAIDQARQDAIWRVLAETRGSRRFWDLLGLVRYFHEQGKGLTVSELMYLQERTTAYGGPSVVPESVARFFLSLLEERQVSSVLDPLGGLGLLGAFLAENLPDKHLDVVTPLADAHELIESLMLANLTLHIATTQASIESLAGQYDAIVSIPPLNINKPKERRSYLVDGTQIDLVDDPSLLILADLAPRLSSQGFFALIVAPQFAWDKNLSSVRQNLFRFGLHLSALLKFRPGAFVGTNLAFELAIIDRKPRETMFVAEIPEDADAQAALVGRLRKRKQGLTPSQGRLVRPDGFHGLAGLEARERYDKLAKGKDLEPVPFSRVVAQILSPKRRGMDVEGFEENPYAVYLPEMAATKATTRQDELPPKLKSYLQLLVNPNVVLPEYLAGFLNTPMGHALRQMVMTGVTIPRINRSLLLESKVYLPPIDEQRLGLQASREIQRLRTELSEHESKLWEQPRHASSVVEAVRKVNHEERFSDWIETLPFPLASILRSYHASDRTPKEKYERLLHFFEAFTEFCAMIHVSAIRTNVALWQPRKEQIGKILQERDLSLMKPTFGSWRVIAELMAGSLRSMLNEESSLACELYATADTAPLKMLAATELVGLFQRTNNFRNRWKGHGGSVSEAEAAERHSLLENDLAKTREILGTNFLRYQLIEPREAEILEGPVFRCLIRRVMGSNPQLVHDRVDLTTAAITGRLYLHNPGHDRALKLIPLVQVHDTPQPASYFYNRLEKMQPTLVSYHIASEPEISSASPALLDLLKEFRRQDKYTEEAEA